MVALPARLITLMWVAIVLQTSLKATSPVRYKTVFTAFKIMYVVSARQGIQFIWEQLNALKTIPQSPTAY